MPKNFTRYSFILFFSALTLFNSNSAFSQKSSEQIEALKQKVLADKKVLDVTV